MNEHTLQNPNPQAVAHDSTNAFRPAPLCQTRVNARANTAGLASEASHATKGAQQFDATATLSRVQQRRTKQRRKPYGASSLSRWRAEVVALRQAGGSLGDLQHWLRHEKHLRVERSTITRFLNKLPELKK